MTTTRNGNAREGVNVGVIATFGLVLDGIGFVLLLIFVLVSSVLLLRRESAIPSTSGGDYSN